MPRVFGHGSVLKWSERQDFHLRPPGPRPGALKTELRSDETGGSEGTGTLSLPADNGLLHVFELRIRKWPARPKPWRRLVGGAGNATPNFLLAILSALLAIACVGVIET